jgi:hypothetical protein
VRAGCRHLSFDAFGKAIGSFVGDAGTIRTLGIYRGNPAILNFNPLTSQVVVRRRTAASSAVGE